MTKVEQEGEELFVFGPITTETIDSKGFRKVVKEHHNPDYTTTTLYGPNGEWVGHTDTRGDFMAKPGDDNG